jgi:hypothetical protein
MLVTLSPVFRFVPTSLSLKARLKRMDLLLLASCFQQAVAAASDGSFGTNTDGFRDYSAATSAVLAVVVTVVTLGVSFGKCNAQAIDD